MRETNGHSADRPNSFCDGTVSPTMAVLAAVLRQEYQFGVPVAVGDERQHTTGTLTPPAGSSYDFGRVGGLQ